MNFSWLVPDKLAGCMGPVVPEEFLYLKRQGIGAIVRLEEDTMSGEGAGLADMAEFVPELQPPSFSQMDRMIAFISKQIGEGVPVAVSCRAGLGRTGTVLACHLVSAGYGAEEAIERVRRLRPGSVESPVQQEFVYRYEGRLRETPG